MADKKNIPDELKLLNALFGENFAPDKSAANVKAEAHSDADNITPPESWRELPGIEDQQQRTQKLAAHFAVLADTTQCNDMLVDILKRVQTIDIVDARLVLSIVSHDDKLAKLVCCAPAMTDISHLPPAYQDILRVHNGLSFPDYASEAYATDFPVTAAVFLNSDELPSMFEPETEQEQAYIVAIDTHQDWFVIDDSIELKSGKPRLNFLSHADFALKNISREFCIGGHYIRMLAKTILGDADPRLSQFRNL